jgi:DNA-binding XRE family transcriptional regulator
MSDRDEKGHFLPAHNQPGPGRDSLYDPSMNDMARKLALLGLTDEEMARFFGVSTQTYYNWQKEFPAFFEAVQEGKVVADANVADSLYKRATGEHVEIEKAYRNKMTGEVEIIKIKQYIPGESGAALNWLKNRRKENWRDKVEHEHSGSIDVTTKEQRDAAVAAATRADS